MGLVRDAGSFSKRQAVGRVNRLRGGEVAQSVRGGVFFKDVGRTLTLYFNSNSGFHLGRTTRYVTLYGESEESSASYHSIFHFFTKVLSPQKSCQDWKNKIGILFNLSTYSSAPGASH